MSTCSKCPLPATFLNEGGLCVLHWWRWWFRDYTEDELRELADGGDDPPGREVVAAAYELELRKNEKTN